MARKAAANAKGDSGGARKRGVRGRAKPAPAMSAAEPPRGAHSAPAGGSAGAKPQAWGDHTSAEAASKPARDKSTRASSMPEFGDFAKMANMMTPDQAIAFYKANAALALDVINAAIEGAARVRSKQLEGAAEAREFQRRHARAAAQARDPQALVAAGQGAAEEALERSMRYWSEMFGLIVEIQKRVFTLIDEQMDGVPGVRETRAAMALLPDRSQMQKVVSALQGVVTSGESTFASMQRVMSDFANIAQRSAPGGNR